MDENPVVEMMGRRLRLAVIGGGPGSFIGAMHRTAARLDDRFEIVAAAVSSNSERSRDAGVRLGISRDRAYGSASELLAAEAARLDGADVVAIMTPNDSHHPISIQALDLGFDVIYDKPMANTLDEALEMLERVEQTRLIFCLTHNYTGYPMVRQAMEMIANGELGEIRLVQVEYVQSGLAHDIELSPSQEVPWRHDPAKSGPSLVMGDIGTHAHNLIRFLTGLEVLEVAADIGHIVPDRDVDDFAGALLRFDNGARGTFWVTQAAAGVENSLRVRVSGALGTIEWSQEVPTRLTFKPIDGPAETRTPNGPGTLPLALRSSRIVAGHPEGFHEGFGNIYSDAAEAIAARRAGVPVDPLALHFPTAVDGVIGMMFVDAVVESSGTDSKWVAATKPLAN